MKERYFNALLLICAMCFAIFAHSAFAADHYIAPNGSSSGSGSISSPWDIKTGLQKTSSVKPGDTVWVRGGTYGTGGSSYFNCALTGSSTAPVKVRQYRGERAKVNAQIRVSGSYVWLWGFELTNTSTKRYVSNIDTERPRGILIGGGTRGVKIINMAIHDVGRAGVGGGANGYELYGNVIWGNGIYDSGGTTRGDAAYLNLWQRTPDPAAQNLIRDNIGFKNFYSGFKVYTEWADVYADGYTLDGNVSFDNGPRTSTGGQGNFLVTARLAGQPIKRLRVTNNHSYRTPDSQSPYNVELGCVPNTRKQCEDAVISNNYFVSGTTSRGALIVQNFKNLNVTSNTTVGNGNSVSAQWIRQVAPVSVTWNSNKYFRGNSAPFRLQTSSTASLTFASWKSAAKADSNGAYSGARPAGVTVFVRKNVYEPGERANIIVYNWDNKTAVPVNLSAAGFVDGTPFEIVDAQNYFGMPIVTGYYSANSPVVNVPMYLSQVSNLVGSVTHLSNVHTPAEFNVFIVRKTK